MGKTVKPWTPEENEKLIAWRQEGRTLAEIASFLGRSLASVQWKAKELMGTAPGYRGTETVITRKYEPGFWDAGWDELCEWLGRERKTVERKRARTPEKTRRLFVFGCYHNPFHDKEALVRAVAKWADGCDGCIINGDGTDCYKPSRFRKREDVPLEWEISEWLQELEFLAANFRWVEYVRGNHEQRWENWVHENIPPDFRFLVHEDLCAFVAQKVKNLRLPTLKIGNYHTPFLTQQGDAVIGHPEFHSKIDLRPSSNFVDWLLKWRSFFDPPLEPIRFVAMNHTHRLGKAPYNREIERAEFGTMAKVQQYAVEQSVRYQPPDPGYGIITQHKVDGHWKTDWNETAYIHSYQ